MRAAFICLSLFILSACTSVQQTPYWERVGDLKELRTANGGITTEMLGVWRSRGYGWVLEVKEDGIKRYHEDTKFCYLTPSSVSQVTETLSLPFRYYRKAAQENWAILQLLPDDTHFVVDGIEALPERCESERSWSREDVFDVYAHLFSSHYAFFEERNIDWPKIVSDARLALPSITNNSEFFDLLANMIDGFGDSHTKLIASINGERRRQQDGQGITLPMVRSGMGETPWLIGILNGLKNDILDGDANHVGRDRILWGVIDGKVGYINIFVMGGFTGTSINDPGFREAELSAFDAIMAEAVSAFEGIDAVIIDLSNNRGGYDAIARRLASWFTSEPFRAYTTQARGTGLPPRPREIQPAPTPYSGKIFLLTSDVTVSGGELATLALRQLPNVTQVGQTTRGAFSTVFAKPLPNGWVVELSNEVFRAPDGTVFEESGLPPVKNFEVFPKVEPVEGYLQNIEDLVNDIVKEN